MKIYKSPFLEVILSKKYGILIYSGSTNTITKFSIIEFIQFLLKKNKSVFFEKGILLKKSPKNFILNSKAKSYKVCSNSVTGITIAPTMNCNFNCEYCFVKNSLKNQVITKELLDKIISFLSSKGKYYSIEWFGGEPSLVPELITYFYKETEMKNLINCESILITNGTFEKKEIWSIIENYITTLQITLDGNKLIHDKRRIFKDGRGSFDKIINNLDILYEKMKKGRIKRNIFVDIRCNLDKENISEYKQLRNYILERYNGVFCFTFAKVKHCGIKFYDRKILTDKEYSDFVVAQYHNYGIFREPILPVDSTTFQHCRVTCPNSFIFDPIGNIYKCDIDIGDESKIIGNCFTKKLPQNNTEAKYLFSTSLFLPKKCSKCSLIFQCWGGCAHYRIENNMKKICKYQKFNLKKYIEIVYEIRMARNENKKCIVI
jgi:uncharacterized protein